MPDVLAYADMVDAGMLPGPRIYATGHGVFSGSGIEDRDAAFKFTTCSGFPTGLVRGDRRLWQRFHPWSLPPRT